MTKQTSKFYEWCEQAINMWNYLIYNPSLAKENEEEEEEAEVEEVISCFS